MTHETNLDESFPWERDPNETADRIDAGEAIETVLDDPLTTVTTTETVVDPEILRNPYVGEGADGARRSAEIEISAAVIDRRQANALLDSLGGDSRALGDTVRNLRETVVDVVQTRAAARRQARRAEVVSSPIDVRLEVVGAADDAEVLDALAGAFSAAAKEAREIAGDYLDEVPGRGGRARASLAVADGHGFELSVKRETTRDLVVEQDDVVDVLVARSVAGFEAANGPNSHPSTYAAGVREGIAALRSVLSSSPSYRSTALDALRKSLENAGEDDLARRLVKAYARVDRGEPRVKVERKPLESEEAGK